MSYLHDEIEDDDTPRHSAYNAPSRELTLSTGTILGIFFGLAILCAVFFGFGYSMGSKARQAPIVTADTSNPDQANFNNFKPSGATPTSQPTPTPSKSVETPAAATPAPVVRIAPPAPTVPARTETPAPPAPAHTAPPAAETGLTFIVQVAAVSHQEDADLLVAALRRKSYAVAARNEPQDKLIHIQIGPFPSKKEAEAMRQRLLGDGYNALVK